MERNYAVRDLGSVCSDEGIRFFRVPGMSLARANLVIPASLRNRSSFLQRGAWLCGATERSCPSITIPPAGENLRVE